jgi:Fe-S cluster assembly protein SufD
MTTQTMLPFVEDYGALRGRLPGEGAGWLEELREDGMARFTALGLPTPRLEAWKYTNLRPLEKVAFRTADADDGRVSIDRAPSLLPAGTHCHRLVFVNGQFRADLSALGDLPEGVQLDDLAGLLQSAPDSLEAHLGRIAEGAPQAMMALNTAMMSGGFVLRLGRGVVLHEPIEIVCLGGGAETALAYHPRNLIVLEDGAQATVIEHHDGLGGGPYLANGATEISLAEKALLRHYKLQAESSRGFHLATLHAELARDASYDSFTLSNGARLSRHEIAVRLAGEGAECHLNGAYLMRGEQHFDATTVIEHLVPHTTCRETFKGVIDDKARAVFQGRIVVHRGAQKANGHQLSKALLLSDRAEIDTKPELEIYADDVLCSHGATAGDLDHEALFYLRSRGIPEAEARAILIEAFLGEAVNAIAAEGLCPALMTSIGHWLADT